MAFIADKIDDIRRGSKDRAILLDGGDIFQGTTLSNLTGGESLSAAYELMGYDAVTVGNHEFDWGIDSVIDSDGTLLDYDLGGEWQGENNVPVIISNLYRNGDKVPWGRDYILLHKKAMDEDGNEIDVNVAVIGLAGNYGGSIMTEKFSGAGYSIHLDYADVNQLASQLESAGACDATVLLVHDNAEETALGLGEDTAVDLVLGGHTHLNVNAKTAWGLRYMEPSCYGKAYARVDLAFFMKEGKPVFDHAVNAKVVSVPAKPNASQLNQRVVSLTDYAMALVDGTLNAKIGSITESVLKTSLPESGGRSSTCGNWMSSILARMYDADVGFVNSGGLRAEFPVEGSRDITRADIYAMFPFDNRIYLFELTCDELLTALNYALTGSGKTLLSEMSGITCYYSGNQVNAILNPEGLPVYVNGYWLNGWRNKTLKVSACEFIVTSDRPDGGMSNPFCDWLDTDRLLAFDKIDNVAAIEVLEEEAASNGGRLFIDTEPHFINSAYEIQGDWVYHLPEDLVTIQAEAFKDTAVEVILFPDNPVTVEAGAFRNCRSLKEIWLPKDCDIDPTAFEGCSALTAIYAPAGGSAEAFASGAVAQGDR